MTTVAQFQAVDGFTLAVVRQGWRLILWKTPTTGDVPIPCDTARASPGGYAGLLRIMALSMDIYADDMRVTKVLPGNAEEYEAVPRVMAKFDDASGAKFEVLRSLKGLSLVESASVFETSDQTPKGYSRLIGMMASMVRDHASEPELAIKE